jgi:glycosyltransferase involved in cell wall biosynthesis
MMKMRETRKFKIGEGQDRLPLTVIIATRNEEHNLPRCLEAVQGVQQIHVVDSQSTDETVEIARSYGAEVAQFHYRGGWPKKRQWAMDTLPIACDWILLLDADEILTAELREEMRAAIQDPDIDGYYVGLQMYFLGRALRHCGAAFWKLALFRRGKGGFECRLREQDPSMADMEVHEHIVVDGRTARLRNAVLHLNTESLSRYIQKHDEYSNWEARVWSRGAGQSELPASVFGNQAQRRRWLKRKFMRVPGSSALLFFYRYIVRCGFLDGVPGLIYCAFQAIQCFQVKAKMYELERLDIAGSSSRVKSIAAVSREC